MCAKQCRDENGFRCHLTSESHRRQMALLGEAPDAMVDAFSADFEAGFVGLLRRTHPFSRVAATVREGKRGGGGDGVVFDRPVCFRPPPSPLLLSSPPFQLVYNQYIQDKDHIHMNATRWHTLTDFVAHLGRVGVVRVDETETGLHITLVAGDAAKRA